MGARQESVTLHQVNARLWTSVPIEGRCIADRTFRRRGLMAVSCFLFNIDLEDVMRRTGIDISDTIFTNSVKVLSFADDLDIIARYFATVEKLEAEGRQI